MNHLIYTTDCPGKICQWVQTWHECYGNNQVTSGCIYSTGGNSFLVLWIWPRTHAWETMGLEGEPAIMILLNRYFIMSFKLSFMKSFVTRGFVLSLIPTVNICKWFCEIQPVIHSWNASRSSCSGSTALCGHNFCSWLVPLTVGKWLVLPDRRIGKVQEPG